MNTINQIHDKAMDLADLALLAKRNGDFEKSRQLTEESFELERKAAMLLVNDYKDEPSRSVLFRSAACLALDLQDYREAEKMVAFALSGNPPEDIAEELRVLQDEITFYKTTESGKGQRRKLWKNIQKLPNNLLQKVEVFIGGLIKEQRVQN